MEQANQSLLFGQGKTQINRTFFSILALCIYFSKKKYPGAMRLTLRSYPLSFSKPDKS